MAVTTNALLYREVSARVDTLLGMRHYPSSCELICVFGVPSTDRYVIPTPPLIDATYSSPLDWIGYSTKPNPILPNSVCLVCVLSV
jgi:hypothetical protein